MKPFIICGVAGAAITALDTFAFHGEVSPIVIVFSILAVTITIGVLFGARGFLPELLLWVWLPASHLVKHIFGLADTIHPNTYKSIAMLAAFSLAVTWLGVGIGAAIRKFSAPAGATK